jgi:hypothetical protein
MATRTEPSPGLLPAFPAHRIGTGGWGESQGAGEVRAISCSQAIMLGEAATPKTRFGEAGFVRTG